MDNYNISISCPFDNLAIKAKLKHLRELKHGVLDQFFIRKDVAAHLGYISAPFGFPLSSDPEELQKITLDVLNAFQQGNKINLDEINSKYILKSEQLKSLGEYSLPPMTIQDFLKLKDTNFTDVQFRLMYIPEIFNDGSSVLLFSNT